MPEPVDVERVHADAREIRRGYARVDSVAMGGCMIFLVLGVVGAAFAAGRTGDSWLEKTVHGFGFWFLGAVCLAVLYAGIDSWAKSRACKRFYARFPEGGAERDEAMAFLSRVSDDDVSERAFYEALGGRPGQHDAASPTADAAVRDALAKLDPPDVWPPEDPAAEEPTRAPPTWRGGVIPLRPDPPGDEE